MLRKTVTILMGAATLAASMTAAQANNTVRIYDGSQGITHYSGSGAFVSNFGRPTPSVTFAGPGKTTTFTTGNFGPGTYGPGNFGAWWPKAPGVGNIDVSDYVGKPGHVHWYVPSTRPIARPILHPVFQPVVIVDEPAIEVVEVAPIDKPAEVTVEVEAPVKLVLDCIVAGTPVDSPNDIYISNPYDEATLEDMEVSYKAADGSEGIVVLPVIEPGEGVYVSDAVESGMEPGEACSAVEA